ncbi:hypothetical protein DMB36_20410, partial [Acinetobacter baumannii]
HPVAFRSQAQERDDGPRRCDGVHKPRVELGRAHAVRVLHVLQDVVHVKDGDGGVEPRRGVVHAAPQARAPRPEAARPDAEDVALVPPAVHLGGALEVTVVHPCALLRGGILVQHPRGDESKFIAFAIVRMALG